MPPPRDVSAHWVAFYDRLFALLDEIDAEQPKHSGNPDQNISQDPACGTESRADRLSDQFPANPQLTATTERSS